MRSEDLPRSYAAIFDARARDYHLAMARCPSARAQELQAVADRVVVRAGDLVLDAPAGGGYLSAWLPAGVKLVGVEPSLSFFESLGDAAYTEIHLASLTDAPLETGTMDAVVSLAGLHHVDEQEAVFRAFRRAVRPGGRVVIADVERDSAPARFLDGFVDANASLGHVGKYLHPGTSQCVAEAGLTVLSDELVEYPWRFSSASEADRFLRLLFGIDLAAPGACAAAARELLAGEDADGFSLQWGLRFVVAEREVSDG